MAKLEIFLVIFLALTHITNFTLKTKRFTVIDVHFTAQTQTRIGRIAFI